MKKSYGALYALIVLAFIVAGAFLAFLPEQVPMHYDIAGNIDRLGSKYENLILPAFALILGAAAAYAAKRRAAKGDAATERIYLITGIAVTALMNLLSAFFLWKALAYCADAPSLAARLDPMKLVAVGLAALIAVLGYLMPSAPMNRTFGLRTKWSMKNARVWAKCQRFGGQSAMACAALMALAGILLSGAAAFVAVMVLVVAWGAVCARASKRICEKDGEREP